jgi:hypothetical protein
MVLSLVASRDVAGRDVASHDWHFVAYRLSSIINGEISTWRSVR